MIDNDVIITLLNMQSQKIGIRPGEHAIVRGPEHPYLRVRLYREARNGNYCLDELRASGGFCKIRMHHYNTIHLEVTDWSQAGPSPAFNFKVVTGTHHELLFRDMMETLSRYNTELDTKTNTFTVGYPKASCITVTRQEQYYRCKVKVFNSRIKANSEFNFQEGTALAKMAQDIFTSIEITPRPKVIPDSEIYSKNRKFDELILRHFKPGVY